MESITTFLTTNYVYVIGGGAILLIMLIGLIAGKSKNKTTKAEKTVDFKDVQTGSITDVVDVNAQPAVTPVEVAPVATPIEQPVAVESPVVEVEQSAIEMPTVEPMMEPMMGTEINTVEIPSVPVDEPMVEMTDTTVEEPTIVTPVVEEVVDIVDPLAGTPTTETTEPLVDYTAMVNTNQEENKISE